MSALEIRAMPVDQLQAAGYNPRRMTAKAAAKLRASLESFGLVEPLIWNRRTGRLVGGHQRLAILKSLGVSEVPVSVVDLSEEREKALNVVLNNPEAQGRYEPGKLAELLHDLEDLPELDATGFDARTLSHLEYEPAPLEEIGETDDVEITLTMTDAVYETVSGPLDALVRQYDLTTHLKRASLSARRCNATRAKASNLP
jgi:ParB-like chromosome segregation protein Spo0J